MHCQIELSDLLKPAWKFRKVWNDSFVQNKGQDTLDLRFLRYEVLQKRRSRLWEEDEDGVPTFIYYITEKIAFWFALPLNESHGFSVSQPETMNLLKGWTLECK